MSVNPLQYRLDGPSHAPVVLLVPPFGARMSVWEPQMPELTRNHRVLRIDHRGHGGSAAPPGPYRIEDLALDLLSVLDTEGITRVSAVGAGLSSSLLVWIAVNSPRTIDRLVLLAPAPRTPRIHGWDRIAERARTAGMEAVTADVVLPWFTPDMYEQNAEVATALADDVAGLDPEGSCPCARPSSAWISATCSRRSRPPRWWSPRPTTRCCLRGTGVAWPTASPTCGSRSFPALRTCSGWNSPSGSTSSCWSTSLPDT